MKLFIPLILVAFLVVVCVPSDEAFDPMHENMMGNERNEHMQDTPVAGMPCHKMADGSTMGDCDTSETDSNMMGMMRQPGDTYVPNPASTTIKETKEIAVGDGGSIRLSADIITVTIDGVQHTMYGYNGMIPGPIIKAKQGSSITVEFTNNLDQPTTVHWHGLRHDNKDDGVPGVTQDVILPGTTFTYTLRFPDEGVYWYHPHVREDLQQDLGLYGNIIVEPQENQYNPVHNEELLVLDDLLVENDKIVPYGASEANYALMGRFGNTLLVNGNTDYTLTVPQGATTRFFLTSVANARPYNIMIEDHELKLVGSDLGRYERETLIDNVLIGSAERYIVEVTFPRAGEYELRHVTPERMYVLGKVRVTTPAIQSVVRAPQEYLDVIQDIDRFRGEFDRVPDEVLELTMRMHGMQHAMQGHVDDSGIEWEDEMGMMNARSTSESVTWIIKDAAGTENMDLTLRYKVGDVVKIRLNNTEKSMHPMQHPVHLHGQRFLVTHVNGVLLDNLVWKDTVMVPAGSTIDILVDVTNPGMWMLHCHIAEHLTAGMMMGFEVTK